MDDLKEFKLYLIEKNCRPRTVLYHEKTMKRLLLRLPDLSLAHFQDHLIWLRQKGYKASYINDNISTIKIWARSKGLAEYEVLRHLREEEPLKSTMADHEIETFLALPSSRGGKKECVNYDRWTLFFSIMAFTGMRPGEVAFLKVDDVDYGRSVFILMVTKTNTPRVVPIPPHLLETIKAHIDALDQQFLFPSSRGGNKDGITPVVDNVDWHYNFHARLKRMGVKRQNLSPYPLRHSFITRMLEEDVNLFKVQKIVGHRKIETTAHYTHLTTKDIQTALRKDPLIKRKIAPEEMITQIVEYTTTYSLQKDDRFDYVKVQEGLTKFWESIKGNNV